MLYRSLRRHGLPRRAHDFRHLALDSGLEEVARTIIDGRRTIYWDRDRVSPTTRFGRVGIGCGCHHAPRCELMAPGALGGAGAGQHPHLRERAGGGAAPCGRMAVLQTPAVTL